MTSSPNNYVAFSFLILIVVVVVGCVPPDDSGSSTTFASVTTRQTPPPVATPSTISNNAPQVAVVAEPEVPTLDKESNDEPQPTEDKPVEGEGKAEPKDAPKEPNTEKPKTTVASNAKPKKVTFDALVIGMQEDMVYRPVMMTPESKALHGKKIQIPGYMFGGVGKLEGLTELILLRNTECKFGPGGQADHLIQVKLQKGKKIDFKSKQIIYVEGTLEFKPVRGGDGNTWAIYQINDGQVVRGSRF